jgi:hypothetical protein
VFKRNGTDEKCHFVRDFVCLFISWCRQQHQQLFIILREHIFSDTVLGSCVDVLCSSVALLYEQQTQMVLIILCCR